MSARAKPGNTPMPACRLQAMVAALLATLAVGACSSVEQATIDRGHSPAYAAGYADGCESGNDAAGGLFANARKDASRYGADDQYTDGWDAGFEKCRRDMAAMVLDARVRNRNRDK
jgi:hypothetical protein